MKSQEQQQELTFGMYPAEKFADVYQKFIAADITEAQAHLDDLPESQRRGLSLETLRHFNCGYLKSWVNTKSRAEYACGLYVKGGGTPKRLPPPSERIIIPTSTHHFNAVATPRARRDMDKKFWKQHQGEMELFCDPAALEADILVVVEGEVDAMSIWQVTGGQVPVVAILGCGNATKTLGARLSKDLRGKRFVIMLDADTAGKKSAKKLRDGLIQGRVPAVTRYLYDFLNPELKKDSRAVKIDANGILTQHGEGRLQTAIQVTLATAEADLDRISAKIEQERAADTASGNTVIPFNTEHLAREKKSARAGGKIEYSQRQAPAQYVPESEDVEDARRIVAEALTFIPARDLTRGDWFAVGCVMFRYGFDFADFDKWSNDGDSRYDAEACRLQWQSMADPDGKPKYGYKIGTLINIAKEYGYQPPKKSAVYTELTQLDDDLDRDDVDIALDEWQEFNGAIASTCRREIKDAVKFVRSLTVDNITADIAVAEKTVQSIAMCAAFGFDSDVGIFFAALRTAKQIAGDKIKTSAHLGTSPADIDAALLALKDLPVKDFRGRVDKAKREYQKEHKKYRQKCEREAAASRKKAEIEAYLEANNSTRKVIPDCPVDLILPPEVLFDGNNVGTRIFASVTANDRIFPGACNPIVPTKCYRNPDTGSTCYEVAIKVKNAWRTVDVDAKTLCDPRRVIDLAEFGACIRSPKYLAEYFALMNAANAETITEIKMNNQTGWNDDCTEFASPNADDYVIRREGFDYRKIFAPKGDVSAWKEKFVEAMEYGGAPMRVMMGTAAASFLLAPLDISFNLRLHCWGQRSIGKTAAQRFCISAFGDSSKKGLLVPYGGSTPKGRYEIATAFNDCPIVGEEIESLQRRDAENLSDEKYNFFSGTSGKVLHKEGGLRAPKYFRSSILTNGEHPASDSAANGGEIKREVSIHCTKLLPESFAADLYAFLEKNHGLFLDDWTRYIAKNKDLIAKRYHQTLKFAQQRHSAADSTQLTMLVIAVIAYQHFKLCLKLTDLAADADAINEEMTADLADIVARLPTAAEIDDTARAIEFLGEFVTGHEKYFLTLDAENKPNVAFTNEQYGIRLDDGTEYAFIPSVLRKILEDNGFNSGAKLIEEFADRNYLVTNKNRRDHAITVGKKTPKFIHFKAGILARDAEETEMEYYENLGAFN